MKILVLGGCGRMGRIIAADLAKKYEVVVADVKPDADIVMDGGGYNYLAKAIKGHDLVVGALPSIFGYDAMLAAIDSGVNYVDLSFTSHDVSKLNDLAIKNGVSVLHDCGIAPGVSNLIIGRAIKNGARDIDIYVGGVAADEKDDYVISWNTNDLYEEYIRPARIIKNGKVETIPPLINVSDIDAETGLRGYVTDGLRSLLKKALLVENMKEYTWRWPGHIEKISVLLGNRDRFVSGMKELYTEGNNDMLAMKIVADGKAVSMCVYGNEEMSAMARTTALSCSAFAQLLISGKYVKTGIIPPEDIALDDDAYKFVLDRMAKNGVEFNERYPCE